MKIYGIILLLWSLFVVVESVCGCIFHSSGINGMALVFVISVVGICPAIATYTKCGLNSDSSIFRAADEAVASRHRLMQQHFRHWKTIQYLFVVLVASSFVVGVVIPGSINPFLFFVAAVGLMGAAWSIIAYPVALALLISRSPDKNPQESRSGLQLYSADRQITDKNLTSR